MANRRTFNELADLATSPDLAGQDLQALIAQVEGEPEESPLSAFFNEFSRILSQQRPKTQQGSGPIPSKRVVGANPLYKGPILGR